MAEIKKLRKGDEIVHEGIIRNAGQGFIRGYKKSVILTAQRNGDFIVAAGENGTMRQIISPSKIADTSFPFAPDVAAWEKMFRDYPAFQVANNTPVDPETKYGMKTMNLDANDDIHTAQPANVESVKADSGVAAKAPTKAQRWYCKKDHTALVCWDGDEIWRCPECDASEDAKEPATIGYYASEPQLAPIVPSAADAGAGVSFQATMIAHMDDISDAASVQITKAHRMELAVREERMSKTLHQNDKLYAENLSLRAASAAILAELADTTITEDSAAWEIRSIAQHAIQRKGIEVEDLQSEPALECTRCGSYHLGTGSLCPACEDALQAENAALKSERDDYRQRLINAYKWIYNDIADNQYSIKVSKKELKALGIKFDKEGNIIKPTESK